MPVARRRSHRPRSTASRRRGKGPAAGADRPSGRPQTSPQSAKRARTAVPRDSIDRPRIVERAAVKLARRADETGAADFGEHAIERAGIVRFLGDRPTRNALAVALAINLEALLVGDADAPRQGLPF